MKTKPKKKCEYYLQVETVNFGPTTAYRRYFKISKKHYQGHLILGIYPDYAAAQAAQIRILTQWARLYRLARIPRFGVRQLWFLSMEDVEKAHTFLFELRFPPLHGFATRALIAMRCAALPYNNRLIA